MLLTDEMFAPSEIRIFMISQSLWTRAGCVEARIGEGDNPRADITLALRHSAVASIHASLGQPH